jgi:hypothetical protein
MKICITVGKDAAGNYHTLYLGEDADKAVAEVQNPSVPSIVEAELYVRPVWRKRRKYDITVSNGTEAVLEIEAIKAEPEAPKKKKK